MGGADRLLARLLESVALSLHQDEPLASSNRGPGRGPPNIKEVLHQDRADFVTSAE